MVEPKPAAALARVMASVAAWLTAGSAGVGGGGGAAGSGGTYGVAGEEKMPMGGRYARGTGIDDSGRYPREQPAAGQWRYPDLTKENIMGRGILLFLLGVPIPIIILLALFVR